MNIRTEVYNKATQTNKKFEFQMRFSKFSNIYLIAYFLPSNKF
jgi:hypothetical protein